MIWGAHKADGRVAAKNSVKIRAAIRRSIDARQIYEKYQHTHPFVTDNNVQDRARARAWAMMNVEVDREPIRAALIKIWADGFLMGIDAANEAVAKARLATKASKKSDAYVDWANWTPGNRAAALILSPTGAFEKLLKQANITSDSIAKVGYDRIGTALADSIAAGFSPQKAARVMLEKVGDPARALTIAITEQNRAMSLASMQTYQELGLEKVEWSGANPCDICAPNEGQIVNLGDEFESGDTEPPVHPNCRCALLPVIDGMEDDASRGQDFLNTSGGGAEFNVEQVIADAKIPDYGLTGTYNGVNANKLVDMAVDAKAYSDKIDEQARLAMQRGNKEEFYRLHNLDADPLLKGLWKQKGYDGLPTLIDKETFEATVRTNRNITVVYRGVNLEAGGDRTKPSTYVGQYKEGDHFAGNGIFGNGTYTSNKMKTALSYANENPKNVISMILPDNFKTIDFDDIKKIQFTLYHDIDAARSRDNLPESTKQKLGAIDKVANDPGRLATMLGYDGIRVPKDHVGSPNDETYYVILNRSIVSVVK